METHETIQAISKITSVPHRKPLSGISLCLVCHRFQRFVAALHCALMKHLMAMTSLSVVI